MTKGISLTLINKENYSAVTNKSKRNTKNHPRNRTNFTKIGIFAQRSKTCPNRIGVSRCIIIKVEILTIVVKALDAIDGIPVIDT
ncbi:MULTISPECIES: TrmO family methyltransferase domain-containing protein [unclassified Oceanobacillus]|uniref:TrmO family methyltransferase domain-containing protein n=1 Tax=unclassified Oceanobacillus TaxID=2630292 RepID=UPI003FA5FE05